MKTNIYAEWVRSLQEKGLSINTISIYEQSFQQFLATLECRGVEVNRVKKSHVSDFVLDSYVRGNKEYTIIQFVGCIRQFFKFHHGRLGIDPGIFSRRCVRSAFRCFQKAGISKARARLIGGIKMGSVVTQDELKGSPW